MLLGDPGTGKTTLTRYIVRWWLAKTEQHVRVDAARPSEWRDLADCTRTTVRDLDASSPVSPDSGVGTRQLGLWVIDGLEDVGDRNGAIAGHDHITNLITDVGRLRPYERPVEESVDHLLSTLTTVVVTAATAWDGKPASANIDWWGLLRPSPTRSPSGLTSSAPSSGASWMTDPTQARLDWGAQTRPLLPDLRGPVDFPRHRWQNPPAPNADLVAGSR